MDLRITTGAKILEVFWFDEDRQNAGLLVSNGSNAWAGEWSLSEFPAYLIQAIRAQAAIVLTDGGTRIDRAATA